MEISQIKKKFNESIKNKSESEVNKIYESLDIDLVTRFKFYDINIQSFASNLIPFEISQYVFNTLNNWDNCTLADRFIITKLMTELLQIRVKNK